MGEHKHKLVPSNGDGEEEPKLSTHIVMMVDLPTPAQAVGGVDHAGEIEAVYNALAQRAKDEDSFILNVVQSVNVYQIDTGTSIGSRVLITIVAQRIGREDLERQQRLQRMQGGPGR